MSLTEPHPSPEMMETDSFVVTEARFEFSNNPDDEADLTATLVIGL